MGLHKGVMDGLAQIACKSTNWTYRLHCAIQHSSKTSEHDCLVPLSFVQQNRQMATR